MYGAPVQRLIYVSGVVVAVVAAWALAGPPPARGDGGGAGDPSPPADAEVGDTAPADVPADGGPETPSAPGGEGDDVAPPVAQLAPRLQVMEPDFWRAEVLFALQPDQTRSVSCSRGLDCLTPARTYFAGALRGRFERPGAWWAGLTLSLGRAEDHERRPASGYGVLSLRADFQVELGRTAERLGIALRVSPTLIVGWSGDGAGLRTDIPAFAFLLGVRDLWGEVGLPSIPTHADPRLFFVQMGWRQPLFELEAGLATFGSLGYRVDEIRKVGGGFGVWLSGRARLEPTSPWEATLRLAIANPTILLLGVAWRAPAPSAP